MIICTPSPCFFFSKCICSPHSFKLTVIIKWGGWNTHSGCRLSGQMWWPWVWAVKAREGQRHTRSSGCCGRPTCAPGGSKDGKECLESAGQNILKTLSLYVTRVWQASSGGGLSGDNKNLLLNIEKNKGLTWALTSNVRRGTTIVIQLIAMVMCVRRCSAMMSMERRKRTDQMM